MALFIVLSVFSGLKDFSLSFSNDFDPDIKLTTIVGKSFLVSPEQITQIKNVKGISNFTNVIEERVLFMFDGKEHIAILKGVDASFSKVNDVQKAIYQGSWFEPNTTQVVVGHGITRKLSLGLFDFNNPFEVFVPRPGKADIENPDDAFRKAILTPVAVYAINEELDSKYVFADLAITQALLEYKPNQVSAIEFKLDGSRDEKSVMSDLSSIFKDNLNIRTRAQLNDSLYKMLNTENIAVYLIFTLVIIIALFNLIGALIMMILDKKSNLKTLFNLGTEIRYLRKIFLLQGTLLSVGGGIIGLFLGIIVILIQQEFKLIMITPTLAYPVIFSVENVFVVLGTIGLLGFVASLIASSRVSKKLLE